MLSQIYVENDHTPCSEKVAKEGVGAVLPCSYEPFIFELFFNAVSPGLVSNIIPASRCISLDY